MDMEKKKSVKKKIVSDKSKIQHQYTVVLEDIRSENKMVTELVLDLNSKVDGLTSDVGDLTSEMGDLNSKVNWLTSEVQEIRKDIANTRKDIAQLQKDILELRKEFETLRMEVALVRHNQITRDEFKLLEKRVFQLEKIRE
jgi:peptidoglycan hydrolase CwlO-like protein